MSEDSTFKRRKSFDQPGHAHELTFSCYRRMPLLDHPEARDAILRSLARARNDLGFKIWAYVLMPEHVHLLVYPGDRAAKVSKILEAVKRPSSAAILRQWRSNRVDLMKNLRIVRPCGRVECRFWQQGGGYDRNLFTETAILASIEYIHNNPVQRRLVQSSLDWP